MIVMKFGGSSLESRESLDRVAAIIHSRSQPRLIVVSACGKTTDRILQAARDAASGNLTSARHAVANLVAYHQQQAGWSPDAAAIEHDLLRTLQQIATLGLTPQLQDAALSTGERWSSLLIAQLLNAQHWDARQLVVTDARFTQAAPDLALTYANLRAAWSARNRDLVVLGGFIASSPDGRSTTLGRGGSDFTASLAGAALDAREIEIWTDVDGMLTADPRVFPNPVRLKHISSAEAAELAFFGAKVLHPATLIPAVDANIPVRILNSRRPLGEGTLITNAIVRSANPIKWIASKRGVTVLNIRSTRMLLAHGFLARIFEVFARLETSVDMIATSEVSVSLTLDDDSQLDAIEQELSQFADVSRDSNQAILCLVGDDLRYRPGIVGRAFACLHSINVRMISQGASLLNLSFVVSDSDVTQAVQLLHHEFFSALDPEVFEC
jgi:aspartate kinase